MTDPSPTPNPLSGGDEIQVVDVPEHRRYEARSADRLLGFVAYRLDPMGHRIVLVHTEVFPDEEGKGVGSRLARGVLDDIRARGLKLVVECPFISAYLRRHPRDYEDLLGG
jgi:predicted GNAT family acetyltransferase